MRVPTIKWSNILTDSILEPSIGNRWNWWRWAMHSYPDTPLILLEQALPVGPGWKKQGPRQGTTEAACHTSFWYCSTLPLLHPRWAALPVFQLPCRNSPAPPASLNLMDSNVWNREHVRPLMHQISGDSDKGLTSPASLNLDLKGTPLKVPEKQI